MGISTTLPEGTKNCHQSCVACNWPKWHCQEACGRVRSMGFPSSSSAGFLLTMRCFSLGPIQSYCVCIHHISSQIIIISPFEILSSSRPCPTQCAAQVVGWGRKRQSRGLSRLHHNMRCQLCRFLVTDIVYNVHSNYPVCITKNTLPITIV